MNETTTARKSGKAALTKAKALQMAKARQIALDKILDKALTAGEERDRAVAEAQASGATYAELRDATGLSTTRLTQILRRSRL